TGSSRVTVRPVLHLGSEIEVDAHDPTDTLREQVIQRNAVCVFPGCNRDSRRCDLDHVTPYLPIDQGGGPRQTRSSNLAPLCRFHHRVKTHAGWRYRLLEDGTTIWQGPGQAAHVKPPITRRP
ncbi:MAG TPA: HNH endonuclease signature motif containing protein, partial [Marmoricola sp.]|nr:HNH endonuclease signature motif containing protein [Marmoricola sp.]